MEHLSGGSLEDRLARGGPVAAVDALRWGAQAADGLQAAHEAGLVHRDLKPANMLLSRFGQCAIADFGISLELERRRSLAATTTALTLTPLHAAPEVLDGAVGTVASDVYGLCSSLWQLLSGAPPYPVAPGEGVLQFVYRVMAGVLPPLGRTDVPPGLEPLLRAGLSADPAARPPSAAALRSALLALPGSPAPTSGSTPGEAVAAPGPGPQPVLGVAGGPPSGGLAGAPPAALADAPLGDAGATRLRPREPEAGPVAPGRPGWLVPAVTGGVAVLAGAALAGVLLLRGGGDGAAATPLPPGPSPTGLTAVPVPGGSAYVLSWTPGTPGARTVVQVRAPGEQVLSTLDVPLGATQRTVTVPAGNPDVCLFVLEITSRPEDGDRPRQPAVGQLCEGRASAGSGAVPSASAPPASP